MTYIRYKLSPPLNTYIYYLYYLDGAMPFPREKILPLPVLDLKINFGGALQVYESAHLDHIAMLSESWCVGLWSVPHTLNWPTNMQLFGIAFKPDGAYPFLQLPLSELHNQVVSLDELWGHFAVEIREQLYAAPTIQARFALLEKGLLTRLRTTPYGLDIVQYAMAQLARHDGNISMRAMSDHIGISQNHLNTQFKRMIGIPPEELARFYRFEHVLRSINPTQPVDWTLTARRFGYYDLSHLNKDFVAFTTHNPTEYLRLRRLVHDIYPEHNLLLRNLPID